MLRFTPNRPDSVSSRSASLGARIVQEQFRGYGPQKQRAIDLANNDFILLLDADERLDETLAGQIRDILQRKDPAPAYRLRREEWLYWKWPHPGTRLTDHLRLFDRRQVKMSSHPIHAAPVYAGSSPLLNGRLRHYGHSDISGQTDRINVYTTGSAQVPDTRALHTPGLRMLVAPTAAFIREYVFRRQFLNGWAGYIASRMAAWHAFMRHAKRLERRKKQSND